MQPIAYPQTTTKDGSAAIPAPPPCPLCAGSLIELSGFVRCTRCHFSMCAGCDGQAGPGPWGPAE
jgi:hypothetical protein